VLEIVEREQPAGVIVQFGGQTPLKLARGLEATGVPILGTSPRRSTSPRTASCSSKLLRRARPRPAAERHRDERRGGARRSPNRIGYPVLVRPSYVLGGRAMEIVYDEPTLESTCASRARLRGRPVLVDKFLEDAIEVDVDAIADGETW
jgi:carbamoyl-phosphate synthase large subunit